MFTTGFKDFLLWESASRDIIDFKKIYVDISGGDLTAGLLLSEIMFWYLPSKNTDKNKLRVERDGHLWIACRRYEWWERTRMSPKEADRAINILCKAGLLVKQRYKFAGDVTVHVRLIETLFLKRWNEAISSPPENPFLPKVKIRIAKKSKSKSTKREIPYTETTSETTSEKTDITPVGTSSEIPLKWYISKNNAILQRDEPSPDEFLDFRGPFDTELDAIKALNPIPKFGFKDAVMHVWQLQPLADGKKGMEVNYMGLLSGKGKKDTKWFDNHLEDPATTEEVLAFGGWYLDKEPDRDKPPVTAEGINNNFLLFRQSPEYETWMDYGKEQLKAHVMPAQFAEPEAQPQRESDAPIGDNPKFAALIQKAQEKRNTMLRDSDDTTRTS